VHKILQLLRQEKIPDENLTSLLTPNTVGFCIEKAGMVSAILITSDATTIAKSAPKDTSEEALAELEKIVSDRSEELITQLP